MIWLHCAALTLRAFGEMWGLHTNTPYTILAHAANTHTLAQTNGRTST